MNQLANSPAPAMLPYPMPPMPKQVNLEDVIEVLKREGATGELILSVKELELHS